MACCIAAAVCCAVLTACMSGVALGYNYSLAEYIDLKETNISVYLKRGVFDDDIVDDMDWRRSGHLPVSGHIRDDNLITASSEDSESTPWRQGRRMDDSIFESDDKHKFEGSLMKLTAKPLDLPQSTEWYTPEKELEEVMTKYPPGSLDQLKEVQSVINRRKFNSARYSTSKRDPPRSTFEFDEHYLPQLPDPELIPPSQRRMMVGPKMTGLGEVGPGESARLAVPDQSIGNALLWANPKVPPEKRVTLYKGYGESLDAATYPPPVTIRPGPLRPSRPPPPRTSLPTLTDPPEQMSTEKNLPEIVDDDLDAFKQKLLLNEPMRSDDFLTRIKDGVKRKPDSSMEDYEEDIKGLPVRKKRHHLVIPENVSSIEQKTSHTTASYNTSSKNFTNESIFNSNYSRGYNNSEFNNYTPTNISTKPMNIVAIGNEDKENGFVDPNNHTLKYSNNTDSRMNKAINEPTKNITQYILNHNGLIHASTLISLLKQLNYKSTKNKTGTSKTAAMNQETTTMLLIN